MRYFSKPVTALVLTLALIAAACSGSGDDEVADTTTTSADTTTSISSTTTTASTTTSTTTTSTTTTLSTTTTTTQQVFDGCELDLLAEPVYANDTIAAGFAPDPIVYNDVALGEGCLEGQELGPACFGSLWSVPDFRFTYSGESETGLLRFFFVNDQGNAVDTTLAVLTPANEWVCNDDFNPIIGTEPVVNIAQPEAGIYDVFIGQYGTDVASGSFFVTELSSNFPANASTGGGGVQGGTIVDASLPASFGEVVLEAGFPEDPHAVQLVSGGPIDAASQTGCPGFIAAAPDYRLNWTGQPINSLRFFVESNEEGADTTLAILDPFGEWFCDDDSGASILDPQIDMPGTEGIYDIWVGSYEEGTFVDSVLYITELDITALDVPVDNNN